jgi:hypothetical protein
MSRDPFERDVVVTATPAAPEAIQGLGAARGPLDRDRVVPLITDPPPPEPDAVLEVALEALRFEHAHAEAARSRAAGLLTACGVLLALTAALGSAAAQAAQKLSHLGAAVTVCAAAVTAVLLLAAAAISGQVFAPSQKSRMALEELREFSELRFRAADADLLANAALERLAAARAANLTSRTRSIRAMALYVGALGVLGAQVLLIAIVHLLGI